MKSLSVGYMHIKSEHEAIQTPILGRTDDIEPE